MRIIHFWASATSNRPQQLSMYSDLVINEGRKMFLKDPADLDQEGAGRPNSTTPGTALWPAVGARVQ